VHLRGAAPAAEARADTADRCGAAIAELLAQKSRENRAASLDER